MERLLIVRLGAMGDVIHALPAVATLRQAFPEAQIGWAIEPRFSFARPFDNGLAWVGEGRISGYIRRDGSWAWRSER